MFSFKKITCSVLAALAIANSALSLPSDSSKMPKNVINAMALNKEENLHPLVYAVCTKQMNIRPNHNTKNNAIGTIPEGTVIDLSDITKNDIWVNPNNYTNIWVTNFKLYHDGKVNKGWVCISNSNIKVPNYSSRNIEFLYRSPNTKSTKIQNPFEFLTPLYVTFPRINNDDWVKITYYDNNSKKTVTGYLLKCKCNLDKVLFRWDAFDYVWYKDSLFLPEKKK